MRVLNVHTGWDQPKTDLLFVALATQCNGEWLVFYNYTRLPTPRHLGMLLSFPLFKSLFLVP
jgi:hypothetical protein